MKITVLNDKKNICKCYFYLTLFLYSKIKFKKKNTQKELRSQLLYVTWIRKCWRSETEMR